MHKLKLLFVVKLKNHFKEWHSGEEVTSQQEGSGFEFVGLVVLLARPLSSVSEKNR